MKILSVAEKPSVAKEIANILSRGQYVSRDGASRYNRVFEFQRHHEQRQCTMLVTSVIGHLKELAFPENFGWNRCDPVELFTAPLVSFVPADKDDVKLNLQQAVRGCTELILWLDCDREGEAIGKEVEEVCREVNGRIRVRRARFSALIPADIERAISNLVVPNENEVDAVRTRMELDLRLGAAFTRMQTVTLQNQFEAIEGVLSYGPCQFPTMWFVDEQAKRIEASLIDLPMKPHLSSPMCRAPCFGWSTRRFFIQAFRSEPFWAIELEHRKRGEDGVEQLGRFSWARTRLFDRLCCLVLYELCVERATATVVSVNGRESRRIKPVPLATVELQKQSSNYLRIASDRTMDIAEKLYQQGYLSYPRTETDFFKEGTELLALVQVQAADPRWGGFAQALLDGGFEWPRPGGHDDQAHPPIHPVKPGHDLHGDEASLTLPPPPPPIVTAHFPYTPPDDLFHDFTTRPRSTSSSPAASSRAVRETQSATRRPQRLTSPARPSRPLV
jgi:DNA topoisomerase-3